VTKAATLAFLFVVAEATMSAAVIAASSSFIAFVVSEEVSSVLKLVESVRTFIRA
jgi:hypothetical protein